MKPTYYKLNREELEEKIGKGRDSVFDVLVKDGILEEVQEEEMTPEEAIDNMFDNPLEQVKKLTIKKTMAQCSCGCTQEYPHSHLVAGKKCECEEGRDTRVNVGELEYSEEIEKLYKQSKPFLGGQKPSAYILEKYTIGAAKSPMLYKSQHAITLHFLDLLVEELKKNGSLK